VVAPLKLARFMVQRTFRIKPVQPGPRELTSMEPPRVALPAMARTSDGEIPSGLPRPRDVKAILDWRRVPTIILH
jgi:hypothetical protein